MSDDKTVVPGFIRGYRAWSTRTGWPVEKRDHYLYGVAHQFPWNRRGPMGALCSANNWNDHQAPYARCRCGLYANYMPTNRELTSVRVPGIIDAWGTTILGTTGFRTEKAVIRALWKNPGGRDINYEAISEFYTIPVFDTMEEMLEAFPPTDVSELVDTRPSVRVIDLGPSNHGIGYSVDVSAYVKDIKIHVNNLQGDQII